MEGQDVRLYTYTMTADTGFAPNPYQGMLTLATCKPDIRLHSRVGDWISGWCAKKFENAGGLVYLAKIEKKLTFAEYFASEEFQKKKSPVTQEEYDEYWSASDKSSLITKLYEKYGVAIFGDNIYDAEGNSVLSVWHDKGDAATDLKGTYVLVCKEFYYFGHDNALEVPNDVRPQVQETQGYCFNSNFEIRDKFVSFVKENAGKTSVTVTEVKSAPSCSSVCNSVCNH